MKMNTMTYLHAPDQGFSFGVWAPTLSCNLRGLCADQGFSLGVWATTLSCNLGGLCPHCAQAKGLVLVCGHPRCSCNR
eukprot:4506631-Amphidinium_carterae.1